MAVCGHTANNSRQCGIRAREIALSGASSRQPKPSRMISTAGRATGLAPVATDFVDALEVVIGDSDDANGHCEWPLADAALAPAVATFSRPKGAPYAIILPSVSLRPGISGRT